MSIGENDLELFARAQQHDVPAFETLFRRYHQPLCDFVDAYVRARASAEDIVQDLFVAMWTQGSGWRVQSSLRSYLFAAARNRAFKQLRAQSRITELDDDVGPVESAASDPAIAAELELESAESIRALQRAIASLPPRTRLAITLRWGEEMSHAEIAESMDISLKGVEKLLNVGMARLRGAMKAR
jgi:RNA polymerase sigma-70 factor (ECF subfamily)